MLLGSKSDCAASVIEVEVEEVLRDMPQMIEREGYLEPACDLVAIFRGRLEVVSLSAERLRRLSQYLTHLSNHQDDISEDAGQPSDVRTFAHRASLGLSIMSGYVWQLAQSKK